MMIKKYFCSPLFVMVRERSLYPVMREDHSSMGIPIPGFEVESFVTQTGREGFEQTCSDVSLNVKRGFTDEETNIDVKV